MTACLCISCVYMRVCGGGGVLCLFVRFFVLWSEVFRPFAVLRPQHKETGACTQGVLAKGVRVRDGT